MAKARFYPKANRTAQYYGEGNYRMPGVSKLLWHTTETPGGWPGYSGGASAPTLTYDPWKHQWRQHFPIDGSSRALIDSPSTAVAENRDSVVQVEISAYCDPKLAAKYGHAVWNIDDQALNDLADFVVFLHKEWGLPLRNAPVWYPYPKSGWKDSDIRMSGPEYDKFTGILGHMHASSNFHGDPGALNVTSILARAKKKVAPILQTPLQKEFNPWWPKEFGF